MEKTYYQPKISMKKKLIFNVNIFVEHEDHFLSLHKRYFAKFIRKPNNVSKLVIINKRYSNTPRLNLTFAGLSFLILVLKNLEVINVKTKLNVHQLFEKMPGIKYLTKAVEKLPKIQNYRIQCDILQDGYYNISLLDISSIDILHQNLNQFSIKSLSWILPQLGLYHYNQPIFKQIISTPNLSKLTLDFQNPGILVDVKEFEIIKQLENLNDLMIKITNFPQDNISIQNSILTLISGQKVKKLQLEITSVGYNEKEFFIEKLVDVLASLICLEDLSLRLWHLSTPRTRHTMTINTNEPKKFPKLTSFLIHLASTDSYYNFLYYQDTFANLIDFRNLKKFDLSGINIPNKSENDSFIYLSKLKMCHHLIELRISMISFLDCNEIVEKLIESIQMMKNLEILHLANRNFIAKPIRYELYKRCFKVFRGLRNLSELKFLFYPDYKKDTIPFDILFYNANIVTLHISFQRKTKFDTAALIKFIDWIRGRYQNIKELYITFFPESMQSNIKLENVKAYQERKKLFRILDVRS